MPALLHSFTIDYARGSRCRLLLSCELILTWCAYVLLALSFSRWVFSTLSSTLLTTYYYVLLTTYYLLLTTDY